MSQPTCDTCGATLPSPGATCRRCLMELAAGRKPAASAEPVVTRAPRPGTPPPAPDELAPLFPELEIDSLLGMGGMGAVYKARQKRLGRDVALKVLHGELSDDALFVERFLREAQALAKLAHPGIVAVHDFGERERRCYLVMEYVDGANLRALLRAGLLPARQALDIVRQLCVALQFAHDEGVVHRDIKPENVLVDSAGRVKIADFGLAKLLGAPAQEALTSAGQVMGTPHYMAPEQLEHPRDVDHRADLFSLGVVFYEMLTGELPLGRFAPPSERVQVDVRLDEIVLKSLERERERRYQHATQVKTAVERVEHGPASGADSAPRTSRETAHAQRHAQLRSGVYLPRLEALFGRHTPTAWGWLALFAAAWIVVGAGFGFGPWWFALVSVPLLSWLFLSMVTLRSAVETRADSELGPWIGRLAPAAFLLAALGFVTLFVAHVASWERWTWAYVSSPQAPRAGIERWKGAEPELLRLAGLAPARTGLAATEPRLEIESAHWLSNPYGLFELHPVGLFALAGALLTLAAWLVARTSSRPSRERRRAVASSLALLLGALAGVHLLTFALHGGEQQLSGLSLSQACRGDAHALGQRLYQGLVARELAVHAEHAARIVDRQSGAPLAEVHVLAAAPASAFARWRMTWSGPRRIEPHVLFTLVSDPAGEHATILADAGLVEPRQLEASDWSTQLERLVREACAEEDGR